MLKDKAGTEARDKQGNSDSKKKSHNKLFQNDLLISFFFLPTESFSASSLF